MAPCLPVEPLERRLFLDASHVNVSSTSPAAGSVVALPMTTLDVTFDNSIRALTVGTIDLSLSRGTVTAATLQSPKVVRFTISGLTSTEGTLTATIPAGAVSDVDGKLSSAFSASYVLDAALTQMPAFVQRQPLGSLSFESNSPAAAINPSTDADEFLFVADPLPTSGQLISLIVTPTSDSSLQPTVELIDQDGVVRGSATAPSSASPAVLQTSTRPDGGMTSIRVTGATGSTGSYTVTAILGAVLEGEDYGSGPTNDTQPDVQDLTPAFRPLLGSSQATPIDTVNVASVQGKLPSLGGEDWYQFTLPAGESPPLRWRNRRERGRLRSNYTISLAASGRWDFGVQRRLHRQRSQLPERWHLLRAAFTAAPPSRMG